MAEISLVGVSKVYPGEVRAVDEVSLDITDGEFMVLVGPSGCGKSTLLRMICGLEEISEGSVRIGDRDVTDLTPRDRDVAMVFQNYALYPHMTVRKNLGYALRVRGLEKADIDRRVGDVAKMLGLDELLERKPSALSGGQRQRVAMGRAIVREPAAYLMDEPLSNLDAKLRVTMRGELSRLHDRLATTTVYVTHDQVEAMTLGQRVAVMNAGRLQQVDTPKGLYQSPINLFVAAFIGSPAMNLVEAEVTGGVVRFGGMEIPVEIDGVDDGPVVAGFRPEAFEAADRARPGLPTLEATPSIIEDLGAETHLIFDVAAPRVESELVRAAADSEDEAQLLEDSTTRFVARVDPRSGARLGAPIRLAVEPEGLYLFDRETGANLALRSVVNA